MSAEPSAEPAPHSTARPAEPPPRPAPAGSRILFVVNVAWFFLSHRLPLARAARDAGYEVHLLTQVTDAAEIVALEREKITLHKAAISRGGINPIADVRFFLRVLQVLRRVRPLLLHNVTVKPIVYATVAGRLMRTPAIINALSGLGYAFSDQSRWLLARALTRAYRLLFRSPRVFVIFQNRDDERAFVESGIADPERTALIRGSGVDLFEYFPAPREPSETPLVILPARMLTDKGVLEFAAAARLLRERGCRARFACAGRLDPANPAALDAADMQRLQADTPIEWLRQVEDMPALYRRAHVVCLPSYREGLPKSLIEACAAGLPVVTTDLPGCREVVAHGVNGLLVPARDPEALADALHSLLADPGLRERMGAAGRARAEAEFAVSTVVAATMKLYERVLSRA